MRYDGSISGGEHLDCVSVVWSLLCVSACVLACVGERAGGCGLACLCVRVCQGMRECVCMCALLVWWCACAWSRMVF